MWELDYKESWAPKNWCFWTVVLEKTPESPLDFKEIKETPEVPWTSRRSFILKEISPEYSLEGLMLKLKVQYFGHLMPRTDSLEKTLMLGKFEGRRRRRWRGWDGWMASMTRGTWVWVNSRSWWWTGKPGMLQFMGSQRVRHDWATKLTDQLCWASRVVLVVKNLPANAGDMRHGFDPWVGRIPWRRAWQPTLVFLSGEPHGQRNLTNYSL